MAAYYVHTTTKDSEYRYDFEIKGQRLIFLNSVNLLTIQTPLSCIDGVFIFSIVIAYEM